MLQNFVEGRDDDCYAPPRLSTGFMSCLVPPPKCIDATERNLSYDQMYQQPLRLTVLKLDGSSFGIEVEKTGTVRDLKRAVEAAFRHLPKKGPRSVSWEHVWGQFCLCHEGEKLLNDGDYIGMISIKDGDQFIHHASDTHQLVRVQSIIEDPDSDDEQDNSDSSWDKHQKNDENDDVFLGTSQDKQDDVVPHCDFGLTHVLRGWFSYHKFSNERRVIGRSSPSRFSNNFLGGFKNCLRLSSSKHYARRQTLKGG